MIIRANLETNVKNISMHCQEVNFYLLPNTQSFYVFILEILTQTHTQPSQGKAGCAILSSTVLHPFLLPTSSPTANPEALPS